MNKSTLSDARPAAGPQDDAGRPRPVAAPWLALLAGPLSFGIAGPALILGDVADGVGVSTRSATAAVTAFGWGIAVGTPLMSRLYGRYGLDAGLAVSAALVSAGTLLVFGAPSLVVLVLGGGTQAVGAAGLTAIAMSLAGSPKRMGLVTSTLATVGSLAPLIGAFVGDVLSWRAALALPLLSVLAVPAVRRAPAVQRTQAPFDIVGAALVTATVTALVLVPSRPVPGAVAAVVAAVPLAAWVAARPDGFLPVVLPRTPRFVAAAGLAFVLAVLNFANLYLVPALLVSAGWTSGQAGVAVLWPLLLGGSLSWFVVAASARIRPATVTAVLVAAVLTAAAVSLLGVAMPDVLAGVGVPLLAGMFLGSIGASSAQGILAVRALSAVPAEHGPVAIGMFNLCYLSGVAFGPALASALPVATP